MKSEIFRFKFFELQIPDQVFPVTTDSVLLGSWIDCDGLKSVLDLGTGTGILSLMLAQRSSDDCQIYGLDVHKESIECASNNFIRSPWKSKLQVIHLNLIDLLDAKNHPNLKSSFDLIVCNPPYYSGQLQSEDVHVSRAKHQTQFDFSSIARISEMFLKLNGNLAVVLPAELEFKLTSVCLREGLMLKRMCKIFHTKKLANSLCLCEYTKSQEEAAISKLVLYDENNQRTSDYASLTRDFYL